MSFNSKRILAHLRELELALFDWKRYQKYTLEEIAHNRDVQNMVFHALLVAIQATIDVANQIVIGISLRKPSSYREVFQILVEEGMIEESLGKEMSDLAGFRNIIVHTYWKVNLKEVYNVLQKDLRKVEEFKDKVKALLANAP